MDPTRVRAAQRELYEAGEYFALSAVLRPTAEALVAASGVRRGDRLLDVGAGDGNVSLAGTDRGALAVALDVSLVQLQRARARMDGLPCVVGDAERLPFADGSFDAVLSAFGAVLAPDPDRVVAELFRVCRPGGAVAITAWPPDSLTGELNAAVRESFAEPDAFPDQDLGWGTPEVARRRFATYAEEVDIRSQSFVFDLRSRGAAGEADFAAGYLAAHAPSVDLAARRQEIMQRHRSPTGDVISDYLLILGRA